MIPSTTLYTVNDENSVTPVIQYEQEDEIIHTTENPHCGELGCPCGEEDEEEIQT